MEEQTRVSAHGGHSKGRTLKKALIELISDVLSRQPGHYPLTEASSLKSFLHLEITTTVMHKDKICKITVKYYL